MTNKKITIAIDGPSASGKGTIAKMLAKKFNLAYLNTGAIYRLIAFRALKQNIDLDNFEDFISSLIGDIKESELENNELFSEIVGREASRLAKNQNLRNAVLGLSRDFIKKGKAEKNGCVLDGRDTTTTICPEADYKFFITADVEIRAKRRFKQLQESYEEILQQLQERDDNDKNRKNSPLIIADDAIVIDNGKLSIEESFSTIVSKIK
jgi:cytidylate kinase